MANLLTQEFEHYIAEQTARQGTVVFDEFIFAYIPGLNEQNLSEHLTIPQSEHIVHRQAVSQTGVVNEKSVVYSVTIGTEVGDWDYNFIGLINKSENLLACAIQTDTTRKIKNKANRQGNSLTRSILLEFDKAQELTQISVNANTWQIDFTLRLSGIDEKIRLTNRDLYGRAVFFDDGFLVKRKTGNQFTIETGNAYIEGVRADLTQQKTITANYPCSVYLDVVHHATVTGAYATDLQFLTEYKNDYQSQDGFYHYVQEIAYIDERGNVHDRRTFSKFLGITPKDLTAQSESTADHLGHSHKLPRASTSQVGIVSLSHKTDGADKTKAASEYALGEVSKKSLPLGSIISFPKEIESPAGFLQCNGSTFSRSTYPDLYQVMGNKNKLPNLTRSNVGMMAYFATDEIPEGWIAFDDIATQVTQDQYPELYRYLINKYGSIEQVPKAQDRFIRNAGNGLNVGETQLGSLIAADSNDASTAFSPANTGDYSTYEAGLKNVGFDAITASDYTYAKVAWKGGEGASEPLERTLVYSSLQSSGHTVGSTRPKSIILKLCIKAKNTLDDVVFWIKAYGEIANAGSLDAESLAADIQNLRQELTNTAENIKETLRNETEKLTSIVSRPFKEVWSGNLQQGGVAELSENIIGKVIAISLQSSVSFSPNGQGHIKTGITAVPEYFNQTSGKSTFHMPITDDITIDVAISSDGRNLTASHTRGWFIKKVYVR